MSCKHHPKYDHTAGDPKGETPLQARATNRGRENCKDCWQVRAKWLEQREAVLREALDRLQEQAHKAECFPCLPLWERLRLISGIPRKSKAGKAKDKAALEVK